MKNWIRRNKVHIGFCLLILLSVLIVHFRLALEPEKIYAKHDILGYEFINLQVLSHALTQEKEFPLWTNTIFGGTPFFAQPQIISTPHILLLALLFAKNISLLINFGTLLNVLIAGILMYYLMVRLKLAPRFAFLSSLIFMFCGQGMILTLSWFTRQTTIIFTPLIFLLVYLALYGDRGLKQALADAMLAGLFLTFQFHTGGIDYAMFMLLVFMCMGLVYLIGRDSKNRAIRLFIVGLVVGVAFLGTFAMKLLPLIEFGELSSKSQGYNFESWRGQHLEVHSAFDLFQVFVTPYLTRFDVGTGIGLIALVLILFTLPHLRRRPILTFWTIFLVVVLFTLGIKPLLYPFFKFVPAMDKLHHVARAAYLFQFAAAALAGFGASFFFQYLEGKNLKKKMLLCIFCVLAIGIVAELGFIESGILKPGSPVESNDWGRYVFQDQLDDNTMMQYLAEQPGIFRVNHFSHGSICGIALNHISYHGLEPLYGCFSVWIPEYFNVYLAAAYQDSAKMKGMLNTKYFFEDTPLNVSGLKLIKTFEPCEECWQNPMDGGALDGPYLYENEKVLPRAYLAEHAILVAGQLDNLRGVTYALLLQPDFNPVNTVLVMHQGSLDSVSADEFKRYSAIILTDGQLSQKTLVNLQNFQDKGGLILPDIFKNKQSISPEEVSTLFSSFKKEYREVHEIPITSYTGNSRQLKLSGERGFLVLAEKFSLFEGWNPKIGGKTLPILRANGINSAVYLNGEKGDLEFTYSPKSFILGSWISGFTLTIIIGYLFWNMRRKKDRPNPQSDTHQIAQQAPPNEISPRP